jgi:hypothetical protein
LQRSRSVAIHNQIGIDQKEPVPLISQLFATMADAGRFRQLGYSLFQSFQNPPAMKSEMSLMSCSARGVRTNCFIL